MSAELRNMCPVSEGGRGGSIVNAASTAGLVGKAGNSIYCASKHAVVGLTKAAAREQVGLGIRINAIAPQVLPSTHLRHYFSSHMSLAYALVLWEESWSLTLFQKLY